MRRVIGRWRAAILAVGLAASAFTSTGRAQRPDAFGERYYQLPPGSPNVAPGLTVRDYTSQLAEEGHRLIDDVNYELAGTAQGRQALPQAVALSQGLDRSDELASRMGPTARPLLNAISQVDPAFRALQITLNNPPGVAPSSNRTLYRVGRLYDDLLRLTGLTNAGGPPGLPPGPGPGPGPGFPPGPGGNYRPACGAARRFAEDVTQCQLQLSGSGLTNYSPYNRVSLDLVNLGSAAQNLAALIDRQVPADVVYAEMRNIDAQIARINGVLGTDPNVPPLVGQCWGRAMGGPKRIVAALSAGPGPGPIPPPVIPIPQPTVVVPTIHVQPQVVPPLPPAYGGALAEIDQWLAETEQLVAVQSATVTKVPQGFQLLGEAKELRASLIRLRQAFGSGGPPPMLQGALRQVERDYARLRNRVDSIAGFRSGPNIELVRSMQFHLEQLRGFF